MLLKWTWLIRENTGACTLSIDYVVTSKIMLQAGPATGVDKPLHNTTGPLDSSENNNGNTIIIVLYHSLSSICAPIHISCCLYKRLHLACKLSTTEALDTAWQYLSILVVFGRAQFWLSLQLTERKILQQTDCSEQAREMILKLRAEDLTKQTHLQKAKCLSRW